MEIAGYIKTSLIEWPGKIAAVIFVPGCNFRCPFCHNRDLVLRENLKLIEEGEVIEDLEKRKGWVEAVAVTGGEPTLQADLEDFLRKIKKEGFLVMLETNGSQPQVIGKLVGLNLVDFWAMDIKGELEDYQKFTKTEGMEKKVRESLARIAESGKDFELRTTVVRGLHDLEGLRKTAEEIKRVVGEERLGSFSWYLQQFRPQNTLDESFLTKTPFSEEEMKDFQRELEKVLPRVFLRVYN